MGTAAITNAATGAFSYMPNPGQTGQDTFMFQIQKSFGTSAPTTETILIGAATGNSSGGGGTDVLVLIGLMLVGSTAVSLIRIARRSSR